MNSRQVIFMLLCALLFSRVLSQPASGTSLDQIVTVPQGFTVDVYARGQGIISPTVVAFAPDSRLYILSQNGQLNVFDDDDRDGYAEAQTTVYDNAQGVLNHAVGLAWYDGNTYVSDSGRISIVSDSDGDEKIDTITPIIEGLVSLQYWGHSNNGIAFGPDGKLYVGIGSTTDHGPINSDGEAIILRMNPDGSQPEVFATGFRNPYDLAFSPDGALFTADNNPDRFDKTLRYLPSEELDHVQQGHFYGFPEVFGEPYPGNDSTAPVTNFFPSVASSGLVYYAADQFPEAYRNAVYVAQWGSLAHPVQARDIRNGYEVVYVPLSPTDNGTFTGDWEVFAMFHQELGEYRPVDVTVGPDGALYILEYNQAVVYRVRYTGGGQPQLPPRVVAPATPGEILFSEGANGAPACTTCHVLDQGISGIGPMLAGLSELAAARMPSLSAREYVRLSIMEPNAYVVEGYPVNLMYPEYAQRLSEAQIESLIDYVLSLPAMR
ncbi:MAG: PQQ-dependent sugar dehydrogenase [Chloroflexota bacterium]